MTGTAPKDPVRVLVIDDSASIRIAFKKLIAEDPGLEMIGAAADPFQAAEMMRERLPDVLLLDLQMPRMDGLTFLKKIMSQRPMPVVVISSFTEAGSRASLRALELGAAEVLAKPRIATAEDRREAAIRLCDAIHAAYQSGRGASGRGTRRNVARLRALAPGERFSADVILPPMAARPGAGPPMIAIGASTGGTEAVREILESLPVGLPPIAVVQHMPEHFTRAFAERLNALCAIAVKEAEDGDVLVPGQAVIAPGDRHLVLRRDGRTYRTELRAGPCVSRHRPSVDVLFRSVAQAAGQGGLGVLLTGMGDDGAAGMGEMRAAGAWTIAQDEASCVVYGMPRAAEELGAVCQTLPLDRIAREIIARSGRDDRKAAS
ncbi:chemotaxis response regulator protein-glutamate methylesterase [Rhodovulum tesquicola]|uniref:Protein-glutamate methylesterase/protein-glutamine glutaminase n=1 Tax=Rhodovulum steppense TaxID=540251 RepID=A0A4R1YX00_9RHOB|nr:MULTISPECIES: chemotaxis response regulator protein-glutamate methylesterase [Rhodovulum]MCO8145848.1 chemotaxis response regulator protein-glutamate methylesterase [Rhodovulum tesquicola]TCM85506.1 two-component system chemotaxis response regulator CheB [Rhodovulum steppense]